MAFALHNYALATLFLFFAINPFEGTYASHHHQHNSLRRRHGHRLRQKSLHFTLFQHETLNKTGYAIVSGIEGGRGMMSETTTPFGTLFVFQDPLTAEENRSSKQLGTAEGASITCGLDGLSSISVAKLTLRLKNHKGSISILGGTNNMKRSDHPVVGGTDDFLFVNGYVTSFPIHLKGPTVVYNIGFHLYWPPYPPQAS